MKYKDVETNSYENIIHVCAEVFPFSKKGGLADVLGILPEKISKYTNINTLVISPFYKITNGNMIFKLCDNILFSDVKINYKVYIQIKSEVVYYFIKLEDAYSMDETYMNDDRVYNETIGLQYFVFGKCVVDFISKLNLNKIALFTHDWHVSAIYPYLKNCNFIKKSIHVIHNFHFQGEFNFDTVAYVDKIIAEEIENQKNYTNCPTMTLFAIMNANSLITVSPCYARELITQVAPHTGLEIWNEFGEKLIGILNGVDYDVWNPKKDELIYNKFYQDSIKFKTENKINLFGELNINYSIEKPLVLFLGRLTTQKGIDLFVDLKSGRPFSSYDRMKSLTDKGIFFIICGNCEGGKNSIIHRQLKELEQIFGDNFKFIDQYNEQIAHKLFAAADIFLMPSRYEPCGLTQMYALSYGAFPVVNSVGGLNDTIVDLKQNSIYGNGIKMNFFSFESLSMAIDDTLEYYYTKEIWTSLIQRCMKLRFTWDESVEKYSEKIFI